MREWILRVTLERDYPGGESYTFCLPLRDVIQEFDTTDFNSPFPSIGFDTAVTILKERKFRRDLLIDACRQCGEAIADRMEDAEGWHGESRQEKARASR